MPVAGTALLVREERLMTSRYVPDYFQDDGQPALRERVSWFERELGVNDRFFARHLRIGEDLFRNWRRGEHGSLPAEGEKNLRALWMTTLHLLSFLNFDERRVRALLGHPIAVADGDRTSPSLLPWAGDSLIAFLEEKGPEAVPEVDRWMSSLRFGGE